MKIDAVFSGGGVKAFAFLGALKSIEKKHLSIERVAGTSAGAIIAALLAANYSAKEMEDLLLEINLKKLLDPPHMTNRLPLLKWIFFYFQKGLYKGNELENWLERILLERGIQTFAHIKEGYLKIIVSDISLGKLIIIPDDLEKVYGIDPKRFKVATAVRMSASYPYFFVPKMIPNKQLSKSYIIDGGILSNFPLWIFQEEKQRRRPVLGVNLSDTISNQHPIKVNNALDMLQAIFQVMMKAHDARYISKTKEKHIVFIPVKRIKTTDIELTNDEKRSLIELGENRTDTFLQKWSY